jgi:hypothetical protein
MSDQEAWAGQAMPHELKKRIVPFEEDTPSIEPLFINCAQAALLGDDFYLDVGVVTLESADAKAGTGNPSEFAVISRLVMGKLTATMVRDQLSFVLAKLERTTGEGLNASS